MKTFLFYLAAGGGLSGLVIHLFSIADFDIATQAPSFWVIHLGVFVVWWPAVLEMRKNEELQQSSFINKLNPSEHFRTIFRHTPKWLAVIAVFGFYYAFVNMLYFGYSQHGSPDAQNGQFILHNHGQLIEILTEQEYHHYRANESRAFSGCWMGFYGLAAAILFPFNKDYSPLGE